jgi:hypothetical protein
MSLPDDIRALRDRVLIDLNAAHDYYNDTVFAWRFVQKFIISQPNFTIQNTITGTVTTPVDLASKSRTYIAAQLTEATFQQFISIFEGFFFDFLRLWLAVSAKPARQEGGLQGDFRSAGQRCDYPARGQ